MKFTLSWLKDHLETNASLDDILYALTDLGLEVEGVENPAERLADFTIGKVVHAEKHPDADKLRVCQVETDAGKTQIICGAPNAREGITVVVAKPGVYVPGIDTTIGVGKIRGIESYGMMCPGRVPLDVRRVQALRGERGGGERGDGEGDGPAKDDAREQPPVDAAAPLEQRHAGGGPHLAVRGAERDAEFGAHEHDDSGAELDAQPSARGYLREAHTDLPDDVHAERREADD